MTDWMRRLSSAIGFSGVAIAVGLWSGTAVAVPTGDPAITPPQRDLTGLGERIAQMFSPEIQTALSACVNQGGANLAASASGRTIQCGDGSSAEILYDTYLDTAANFFAGSLLLGMSRAAAAEPRLTPANASLFFASEGSDVLRQGLQRALAQSQFIAVDSADSINLMTDAIVQRATDTLDRLDSFNALLGTPDQTSAVVANFCTPPGMSVTDAQAAVPGLSSVQLYAICLNAAGLSSTLNN